MGSVHGEQGLLRVQAPGHRCKCFLGRGKINLSVKELSWILQTLTQLLALPPIS